MSLRSLVGLPVSHTHSLHTERGTRPRDAARSTPLLTRLPAALPKGTRGAVRPIRGAAAIKMQCDARQCRVPRAPQLSNRATVQGGNMNGLLAARRICREKVNILIHSMPRRYQSAHVPPLYSPAHRLPEEKKQAPTPGSSHESCCRSPQPSDATSTKALSAHGAPRTALCSQRSSADSKRCDILLAEPLKAPNGGLLWSNISITFKKTLCIAVQFYPGLLLEALRHSCRRQLNLLPIPIIPCPPKD